MTTGLTSRQLEVVEVIRSYTAKHGYPPSNREIAIALGGMSTNAIADHLRALERKGAIKRTPKTARALVIVDPPGAEIGAMNAWACPRGLSARGAALLLLAGAVAACGRRRLSTVMLVAQLAESPSILAERIGETLGRALIAACGGRDMAPLLSDQDWSRAFGQLVAHMVVATPGDDELAPGPHIATMTDRAWARERTRFAAHCLDTMPELGVLLVRGAA